MRMVLFVLASTATNAEREHSMLRNEKPGQLCTF
jgi:hypothetical protein